MGDQDFFQEALVDQDDKEAVGHQDHQEAMVEDDHRDEPAHGLELEPGQQGGGVLQLLLVLQEEVPDLVQTRSSFPGLLGGKEEVVEEVSYEELARAWAHYLLGGAIHYLRRLVGSMGGFMGGREDDHQNP